MIPPPDQTCQYGDCVSNDCLLQKPTDDDDLPLWFHTTSYFFLEALVRRRRHVSSKDQVRYAANDDLFFRQQMLIFRTNSVRDLEVFTILYSSLHNHPSGIPPKKEAAQLPL